MKVTVIIPNYNGIEYLKECLKSLETQTFRDFCILVVDNHSTDGSTEFIRHYYPDIRLIEMDKNYGFSVAVNKGIRESRTPYVILLNNDTVVHRNYIKELYHHISSSSKIFSVSSKMLSYHDHDVIDDAGDLYSVLGWGFLRGSGHRADEFDEPCRVFSACAGAAIYRRAVFKKIGLFDELHFAYLEDIDVGYRARIAGYRNEYCPSALVYHVGSATSGSKYNEFKIKLSARNSVYLNYKNMPAIQLALNFLPLMAGTIIKYIFFCTIGYGKTYREGILEGMKTVKKCRKVKFRIRNLGNYILIELELIRNTFLYAREILSRYKWHGRA
jgi:GT2 family glycosyltransferase